MTKLLDRDGLSKLLGKTLAQIDRYRRVGDPANNRPPLNAIVVSHAGRTPKWRESEVLSWAGQAASTDAVPGIKAAENIELEPATANSLELPESVMTELQDAMKRLIDTGRPQRVVRTHEGMTLCDITMANHGGVIIETDNKTGKRLKLCHMPKAQ
jgi:hypothetical protein